MNLSVDIEKKILDGTLRVSFETESGITSLLGSSDCGKSVALKCILGTEKPDRGRIVLDDIVLFDSDKHINLPSRQRMIGCLSHETLINTERTVRQYILRGLRDEKNRSEKERKLREILRTMRLEELEGQKLRSLSPDRRYFVALASVLVAEPRLVLLDEPFAATGGALREPLMIELRDRLNAFGRTVVIATCSAEDAYMMSARIAVMENGRIVAVNNTKALFADPGCIAAARLTGCTNIAPAVKTGEYEVEVPEWGIHLKTAKPVGEGLEAIGLRARFFNAAAAKNRFPVAFVDETEKPFETVYRFRFCDSSEQTSPLWWQTPKEKKPSVFPDSLGIAPANVLLLYKTDSDR